MKFSCGSYKHRKFRYVNDVLKAMLRLQANLLSTPNPITEANTDPWWNCFLNCLGALNGTYIRVRVPVIHQARYRTRKGDIATNVLGVCSQQMNFIYVLLGLMHNIPHTGYYYLVDAGYTNGQGFLAPYRGQRYHVSIWKKGATPSNYQEYFNMKHAQARNVIERCFGLLKMRWAILRSASYYPIRTQNHIITACCLLHNFIRQEMVVDPIEDDDDDEENQPPMGDDFIDTVETSNEWTVWQDTLAMQLYNDCMLATSGFGWNDTEKRIDVESDSVWEAYVRRDTDVKHLKNKTFPYFDEWIQIFGKDRATGEFAEGPADVVEAMNAEEDVLLHGLADNDTFLEQMGVNVTLVKEWIVQTQQLSGLVRALPKRKTIKDLDLMMM
ncbi:Protein ALP1-like [Camellia lanceoleosa]|uniref:Protein ALP1-like n=1 Tax=Camellia lanceoleosa TaxID=1840588 RepID=A0ACC0FPM4_9ERIC|nr:Protein ALP1-like [Camellia lanceoleosa]